MTGVWLDYNEIRRRYVDLERIERIAPHGVFWNIWECKWQIMGGPPVAHYQGDTGFASSPEEILERLRKDKDPELAALFASD